ncbi:TIM barrel protein [bacterium]|nr:TIM barrel protein [bacterium]
MKISLTSANFKRLPAWAVLRLWRWLGIGCSEITVHALSHQLLFKWAGKSMDLGLHLPNFGDNDYDFSSDNHDRQITNDLSRINANPTLKYAVFHPPEYNKNPDGMALLISRLKLVTIPLLLENLRSTSLTDFKKIDEIITHKLDHAPGICLDIPHATLAGDDWRSFYNTFHPRIKVIHLSDIIAPEDSHLPFGMGGELDLGDIFTFLKTEEYSEMINFEISPPGAAGIKALAATWMAAQHFISDKIDRRYVRRWATIVSLAQRLFPER